VADPKRGRRKKTSFVPRIIHRLAATGASLVPLCVTGVAESGCSSGVIVGMFCIACADLNDGGDGAHTNDRSVPQLVPDSTFQDRRDVESDDGPGLDGVADSFADAPLDAVIKGEFRRDVGWVATCPVRGEPPIRPWSDCALRARMLCG
jgi:hypothetical protein